MAGSVSSERISLAAARTLACEARSMGMNLTTVDGLTVWMAEMTDWELATDRPNRIRAAGEPWASEMAVSPPIPPSEGPVMTTGGPVRQGSAGLRFGAGLTSFALDLFREGLHDLDAFGLKAEVNHS